MSTKVKFEESFLKEAIIFNVEIDKKEKIWVAKNKELDIEVYGELTENIKENIIEEFEYLRDSVVIAPDKELTKEEAKLKSQLKKLFTEKFISEADIEDE